jgi:hypothetical protein
MLDLITNLYQKESFIYGSKFGYFISLGITKYSKNVGLQILNNEIIYLLNNYKINNNEIIYYFESKDIFGYKNNEIRVKFYIKNNNETMLKDFYYHIFSVELDLDLHNKINDNDLIIINYKNINYKNELIYLVDYFKQNRKIINSKIPFT